MQDKTGKLLKIYLSRLQLMAGYGPFILNLPFHSQGQWLDRSWLISLWEFSSYANITYTTSTIFWTLQKQREDDIFIMEFFLLHTQDTHTLATLNQCRLYLQVILLSSICSANGIHLLQEVKNGQLSHRTSTLSWPKQAPLRRQDWSLWGHYLSLLEINGHLIKPLGRWTSTSHQRWTVYFHPESQYVYEKNGVTWHAAPPLQATRITRTLCYDSQGTVEQACPPADLVPATKISSNLSPVYNIQYGPPLLPPTPNMSPSPFTNQLSQHIIGPYLPSDTDLKNIAYGILTNDIIVATDGSFFPETKLLATVGYLPLNLLNLFVLGPVLLMAQ